MAKHYNGNMEYNNPQGLYRPNYYAGRAETEWGRGRHNRFPAAELEAPHRGGHRGSGGSARQRLVTPIMAAEAAPREEPLPSLSKTTSQLTNDPLYLESFMNELGTEIRRAPQVSEVHSGHFGFPRLVEEDYKSATARSHIYGINVSESMHAYYVGMNLYARMLEILPKTGNILTVGETDFCTQMQCEPYSVTKAVEQYASGIGNITIPNSADCDFVYDKPDLVPGENIVEFFGPIQANAVDYASYA